MPEPGSPKRFIFPAWTNYLAPVVAGLAVGAGLYVGLLVPYALNPTTLASGYAPEQPVAYSHAKHVGELGMDCRYCHNTVEDTDHAAVPPSKTCWNCHGKTLLADGSESGPGIAWDGEKLRPLKAFHTAGLPVPWVRVHDLADYVYFDHSVHVQAGVGCVECHGRVDKMEVVYQEENLSMGWCLECHRTAPEHLRPRGRVFDLGWEPATTTADEKREIERLQSTLKSSRQLTDCSTCHR